MSPHGALLGPGRRRQPGWSVHRPGTHSLDLLAGCSIGLVVMAKRDLRVHRWTLRLTSDGCEAGRVFGSQVDGDDRQQRVEIAAEKFDRHVIVSSDHATLNGWSADRSCVLEDGPDLLEIGFCDLGVPHAQDDDLTLSLAFGHASGGRSS